MRRALLALPVFGLVSTGPLAAADRKCEIEEIRHSYNEIMRSVSLQGVATCEAGVVRFRLYDGEGPARKFLGVATASIRGHIFKVYVSDTGRPQALSLKYSIEVRP